MIKKVSILLSVISVSLGLILFLTMPVAAHYFNGVESKIMQSETGNRQFAASPLTATLRMPIIPARNQPAELIIEMGSVEVAPNTTVQLELPDGASVVAGPDQWEVALNPGQITIITTTIQFSQLGEQELFVYLSQPIDANNAFTGDGGLRVFIEELKADQAVNTVADDSDEDAAPADNIAAEAVEPTVVPPASNTQKPVWPRLDCLTPAFLGMLVFGLVYYKRS